MCVKGVTKRYPGVLALDDVDFEVKEDEVMALVGQNGAGKTTLVKVLGGVIPPDKGEIILKGKKVRIKSPKEAYDLGFSFIFQEGALLEGLTGVENVFLGTPYPKSGIKINWKALFQKGESLKRKFGIEVNLRKAVKDLSPLDRKKVEILKALSREPKIFVLDEPTAVLTKKEVTHLFEIIRRLKQYKIGIIYISHFLDEIFEIADRVTVLRDGKNVGVFSIKETTKEKIIEYELGKRANIETKNSKRSQEAKEEILKVEGLFTASGLKNIDFTLFKGERLGVFALGGGGKTRLAMALSGATKILSGRIVKKGYVINITSPKDALEHGIILIPQDRTRYGIIENFTITWNLTLPVLSYFRKFGFLPVTNHKKEARESRFIMEKMNIKAKSPSTYVKELSGGNKQKTVIGKGLMKRAEIFIFDEPTQGLDVMARKELYEHLFEFSERGISQIIVSSDIDELFTIAHRIIVMKNGMIKKILNPDEVSPKGVLAISYGGVE